jgi:hypothetical protein
MLLFIGEKKADEYGNTMAYVFLGTSNYIDHYGSKPMSINWSLEDAIPPFMWKDVVKMAVG